jgi:carboxylesterase type B
VTNLPFYTMIAARESDLRVLFKPFPESREGGCHLRIWLPREIPEHCGECLQHWTGLTVKGVVLMFHGGAFAAGQDSDVPHAEVEYLNSNGVVVISAQYRLLPQSVSLA